jgi:3-oxoadipate enol-lactonase
MIVRASIYGGNIFYQETGNASGLPVVLIHGFPFDHQMWKPQSEALAAQGYRVLAYDVRGHGASDVGDGQYSIEAHVDDLISLLDHWKVSRAVVVGLSMGGYIALRALERQPERFAAAALCDTRSEADSNEGRIRRARTVTVVKSRGAAAFADDFVKGIFAATTFTTNPETVATIRETIAHTSPLSIAGTLLALAARSDTTASLGAIRVPTLILVGEHDVTTPVDASESMHAAIASSELVIIPNAAHMSNLENPGAFNAALLAFLGRLPRP